MSRSLQRALAMAGLAPAIHVFAFEAWMPATNAGMTHYAGLGASSRANKR
jgi:hypothetical protein